MRQIKTWKDTASGITNTEYVLKNGIKVIHSLTPQALETVLSIVIKGGAYLDGIANVPRGTAHFLEHLIMGPNKKFKTREEIELFEFGTKQTPGLYFNAGTSEKYVYITGYADKKATRKIFTRMETVLTNPSTIFNKLIEKERSIILSERIRTPKHKNNKYTQYKEFILGDLLPNNTHSIAGELNEIKKITKEDVNTFYKKALTTNNLVISIVTNTNLSPTLKKKLETLGSLIKRKRAVQIPPVTMQNRYKLGHFKDNKEHDIKLTFNFFREVDKRKSHKEKALDFMLRQLILQTGFDILREKFGLVYAFQPFTDNHLLFGYSIDGVSTTVSKTNLLKMLDETYSIFYSGIENFLASAKGKIWLESVISKYIYPPTPNFDYDYAENEAVRILEGRDVFDFEKIKEMAKTITSKDILEHSTKLLQETPPHIWTVSKYNKAELNKIIRKSKFHKRWN